MAKRKRNIPMHASGALIDVGALSDMMIDYAERQPSLDVVMLRLARVGGLDRVEKHILRLRKIVAKRKAG